MKRCVPMSQQLLCGLLLAVLLPMGAQGAEREMVSGTISKIYSYTRNPYAGDVVIQVSSPPTGCTHGFWLSPEDALGFKNTYALLLSAYHTGSVVRIVGSDTELWLGSSGQYCRITFVGLE